VHRHDHFVGQSADADVAFDRPPDNFVVDIGNIAHVCDAKTTHFQPALGDVEGHHHAGMADVAQVVNRHAADIHAHMARLQR
jgi:hypothetical protein